MILSMLESLKPLYTNTLRPVARLFLKTGVHPNHLTLLGLLFFIAGGALSARALWHWALLPIIIGAFMDGLDGLLARESGKKSDFGAILDSSCDRLTEMALLGGLSMYYFHADRFRFYGTMLCYAALCSSVMVSYVKARCEAAGTFCPRGLLQRPERIILLCIGLLTGPLVMPWILGAITLLGAFTVIERLIQANAGSKKSIK
ncbi:MAG: CDP-alcohol phosphatidyltransferase family protein [Chitinispirillaceae bacterium]|nr:CDP-alcohol phosphatidyltransferase family protein [Chitinispirillaceae bacterium]